MPYDQVMSKFKGGKLHSGSKNGPKVKSRDQALAIMLSEKRKAKRGMNDYSPKTGGMNVTSTGDVKDGKWQTRGK